LDAFDWSPQICPTANFLRPDLDEEENPNPILVNSQTTLLNWFREFINIENGDALSLHGENLIEFITGSRVLPPARSVSIYITRLPQSKIINSIENGQDVDLLLLPFASTCSKYIVFFINHVEQIEEGGEDAAKERWMVMMENVVTHGRTGSFGYR